MLSAVDQALRDPVLLNGIVYKYVEELLKTQAKTLLLSHGDT